jgi:hypothetical protein
MVQSSFIAAERIFIYKEREVTGFEKSLGNLY